MTQIIAGFPGIGKSFLHNRSPDKVRLDLDSNTVHKIKMEG